MAKKSKYEQTAALLGALSPDELLQLRDEISTLLRLYAAGGVLTGWGHIELKMIKRKVRARDENGKPMFNAAGEPIWDIKEYGPYAYIRRWIIGEDGKRRLKNVGYYGLAGAEMLEMGHGKKLLDVHNEGGEWEAENLISEYVDDDLPIRWSAHKSPADPPQHPLGDERITLKSLNDDPLFTFLEKAYPVEAREIVQSLRDYESDLSAYNFAKEKRFVFVTPMREINRRRANRRLRSTGQPKRLIHVRQKEKSRGKPDSKRRKR
jgi:hypothetical protein